MFKKIREYFRERRWERLKNRIQSILPFTINKYQLYAVEIINTNDYPANAIIFGHNKFVNAENFGSDKGIIVKNVMAFDKKVEYQQLLFESQLRTEIKFFRFFAKDCLHVCKRKDITHVIERADGTAMTTPVIPSIYFTPYQYQDNIVDIRKEFTIDGQSHFEIPMLPNEKIHITFFNNNKSLHRVESPIYE